MHYVYSIFLFLFYLGITNTILDNIFNIEYANISAILSAAAYCGKDNYAKMRFQEPVEHFFVTDTIYDEATDLHGFVGVLHSKHTIYVVFRGSNSIRNWIEDFEFTKVEYLSFPDCDCAVHRGFYQTALNIKDDVFAAIQYLQKKHEHYTIIITGHSYGASIAQFIAMELLTNGIVSTVYNFGQPRVGNLEYAIFVNSKINVWRIVHNRDIVPHIPFSNGLGYSHSCREVFEDEYGYINICSDVDCEDMECSQQYEIKNTNVKDHMVYLGHNMICELTSNQLYQ